MPDLNRPVFKAFPRAAVHVAAGNCPFCKTPIHPNKDFRDELSRKEYEINGMCQQCQDKFFNSDEEDEQQ